MDARPAADMVIPPAPALTAALRSWWPAVVRAVAGTVVALVLVLLIATTPLSYRHLLRTLGTLDATRGPDAVRAGLAQLGLAPGVYAGAKLALAAAEVGCFLAVGLLLAWRKPGERMALFVALTLIGFAADVAYFNVRDAVSLHPAVRWLGDAVGDVAWVCLWILAYLFPDGRFVPRWTRWLVIPWLVVEVTDRWPVPETVVGGSLTVSLIVAQVYRYRRVSTPVQRQQTKWVMFGLLSWAVGVGVFEGVKVLLRSSAPGAADVLFELAGGAFITVAFCLIPLSLAFAVLRSRLWDIDVIITRTLVYSVLTLGVIGLYIALVGALGTLFRIGDNLPVSLLATGLVAVLFQPLRARLQRAANRLVYGERDEPYAVLARLGQRLEATLVPDAILPTLVQTVAEALKLPYAAIALLQGDAPAVVAAVGAPDPRADGRDLLRLPLVYQQEPVGELRLAPRAPGEDFTPADRRLLADLARQAGLAAHAVRLTADLQRARERLVLAREEERRRLRRDLHDGLGPLLGGLTLKIGTIRQLMRRDLAAADALITDLTGQTQVAVEDIRRLVSALRPPALDELGLVDALRQAATRYDAPDPDSPGLRITVAAAGPLPPLPAAVEVAAYHIAREALTNVVRHARARRCQIALAFDPAAGHLSLAIRDDGQGLPPAHHAGVGLRSMRERASELGGTCAIGPGPQGGTQVRARLPCPPSAAPPEADVRPAPGQWPAGG